MEDTFDLVVVSKPAENSLIEYAVFPKWFIFDPGVVWKTSKQEAVEYFKSQLLRVLGANVPARNFAWRAFNGNRPIFLIDRFKHQLYQDKIETINFRFEEGERHLFVKKGAGWEMVLPCFSDRSHFDLSTMVEEDIDLYNWLSMMAKTAGYKDLQQAMDIEKKYFSEHI